MQGDDLTIGSQELQGLVVVKHKDDFYGDRRDTRKEEFLISSQKKED